ncbi:MAG: leucine-rich repeat protein [Prevotella sp.]|nr:leucine-rich repeat protein [Prevotella sp.]
MKHFKIILLLLAFTLAHNCLAQERIQVQVGNLYYWISGISASVAPSSSNSYYIEETYTIPSSISYNDYNYTVNAIGDYAFKNCTSLKTVYMPNTIKSIGTDAFYSCRNLTSLIIPESVEKFFDDYGRSIFIQCSLFREIIYLPTIAPQNWTATSKTYVPDLLSYSSPKYSMNDAHVIEMISFADNEFTYTGQAPTTTWTNNVEGYVASLTMPALSSEAGDYEMWIPVTFTKGDVSFTAKVVYRYTIKPVHLTAKVNNVSREYGEENPQFNITYTGFVNGENESMITTQPTVSSTAIKTSKVGEYPITISGGEAANYELEYEPGVLTVTKAPLSAKVKDGTKVYGTKNPSFAIEYSGLKNNETVPTWSRSPSFQTSAKQSSGVGQYTVEAINGVPINYELGEITPGTLTITPAPLTIKASDNTRQYYSENPTFIYTCSGFVNGDNSSTLSPAPTITTTANLTSNVGTYEIKATNANNPNYSISYINGTLTITPRTLTASVGNYERLYNEDNPTFEVIYDGFVGNENVNVLNSRATASTPATKTSNVGTYPINVTGGNADNYSFTYTSGTLTINKAEQTISWEQDLTGLNVGDQVELKAEASSGLPITYTMDDNGAAEIYTAGTKTYLDCIAGGQFSIRAIQNGNNNYYSSTRISNTVSIVGNYPESDPLLTIKQADNGSVSVRVSKGSVYTFTITPSNGWRVHSVTFNNSDVTSQLGNDGKFTTPAINSNSTLSVVYEQGSSSVDAAMVSDVKISATSNGVRVVGANTGDFIRVYTKDGLLQKTVKVDAQPMEVPLSKSDVYIVKVSGKTVKLAY